MIDYLKSLVARFAGWRRTPLPPFEDPLIGVREPRRHGPGGRSSAVAVEEPDENIVIRAQGADVGSPGASPRR